MTDIKIGALCWNQYTEWPALLAGRRPRRGAGLRHAVDLGPPVPDRRRLDRPQLRGLADAGCLGAGHEADPDRAHGRREHLPGARRSRPRWRRRSTTSATAARSSASAGRGSRRSTRTSGSSSGPGSRSACAGWARPCRSCAGCSTGRSPRPRVPTTTRQDTRNLPGPDPGPPADLHRRRRREGHPQAGREVRRHEQHRRHGRGHAAQGGGPPRATARRWDAIRARSSGRRASAPCSSATTAPRRSGCSTPRSTATA